MGTGDVVADDVDQLRQHLAEQNTVAGRLEVAVEGVKEPQGGIGGVIDALALVLREQIGIRPSRTWAAKLRRMPRASSCRPVTSVSPSGLIIVSRPQSVNQ